MALRVPSLSDKDRGKLVAKAKKSGVHAMLELLDVWLSDRGIATDVLAGLLSCPLDPVQYT